LTVSSALCLAAADASAQAQPNQPPTVSIFERTTTVYADSPSGGTVVLNAMASDPEDDPLIYSWSGPFIDNPVTTNSFLVARLPLGLQQTIAVTVEDGHGNVATASRILDVVGTPFVGVTATPIDSATNGLVFNYAPVTITATGIGPTGGSVYLRTRLDQIPPVPANLQAGSPPLYFDLSTDAQLVAPLAVCFDTRGMSLASPGNVRLYQYRQSAWVDITSTGYPQGDQLCGRSDTLGTFAIFYPQVLATTVETIAGNGIRVGSNDGPGGNPIDDFVDGPAASTALDYLYGGGYDRATNHLFISSGGYILRVNLTEDTIARVAGNGVGVPGSIDGPGENLNDDLVEGGDALATYVGFPTELAVSPTGDVAFFDPITCRIRRLDVAQGRLFDIAGNGTCGFSGDGWASALASIADGRMSFDAAGNLFLADRYTARVRRIDALTTTIDTVVGDGTWDGPVNGAPARSAIGAPLGLAFDSQGHLLVALGFHLIRVSPGADGLVNGGTDEIIGVVGGCNAGCFAPFNGDRLSISDPRVYLPGMSALTVAQDGTVIFSDYSRVRRITPGSDGIVTGAGDEIITTIGGYYDAATASQFTNFNGDTFSTQSLFGRAPFVFVDTQGRIVVVDGSNYRVRRFGLAPRPVDPSSADVTISATGSPNPVNAGASLRYDIAITNNGPANATGVTMTYVIPTGAAFGSAAGTGGRACLAPAVGSPGTVTCDLGTLHGGASSVMEVTVTPQAAGLLTSTFTVASAEADPNSANNSVSVTATVTVSPALIYVTEVIVVTDTAALLPSAMIGVTETVTVLDTPALLPSVMIGVTETVVVTDAPTLAAGIGGSVIAGGTPVRATDPNGGPTPVTVTFAEVHTTGLLTAEIITSPPATPNGYIFLTPVYDVVTTAAVTAPIDVCFSGWGFTAEDKVMHVESGAWVDRSDSSSSSATLICGRMASLSPVVVVRPTSTITPMPGAAFIAPPVAVHIGAGDQNDPHVSNDLVSYTNNLGTSSEVRCYRFSTGVDAAIPRPPDDRDLLSDVSGNRISYSSVLSDRTAVFTFDTQTSIKNEIDPQPGTNRLGTTIGGNTVAFVDLLAGNRDISAVDLGAANVLQNVSASSYFDFNPTVSPDGNAIVWQQEVGSVSANIVKAARNGSTWAVSPVVSSPDYNSNVGTDGTWVVYAADRAGNPTGSDIYFQPLAGGPEVQLAIDGDQSFPRISGGLVVFNTRPAGDTHSDLFVYDISTNLLYQVTSTPNIGESLADIDVLDNGDVRVVWAATEDQSAISLHDIYATTFSVATPSTLTVSPVTAPTRSSVTLTATLSANGAPVPGERIEFQLAGNPAIAIASTDGNGAAAANVPLDLPPGVYPGGVIARYPGHSVLRLGSAVATADLTVTQLPTSLTLAASPSPSTFGQPVTLTATIASGPSVAPGTIEFFYGGRVTDIPIGSAPIDPSTGTATIVASNLPSGNVDLHASYAGGGDYMASTTTFIQVVKQAPTTIALTSSREPSLTTAPPVFYVQFSGLPFGSKPTGKVEFHADGALLCRSSVYTLTTLPGGGGRTQASCGGASLAIGSHSITATYLGDQHFLASTATAISQTVIEGSYVRVDLGTNGEAVAISEGGQIAGNTYDRTSNTFSAFLYDVNGVLTPLPTLGGTFVAAADVDNLGQVVGSSSTANDAARHAFRFANGQVTDLGTLGGLNSLATAINASGWIVGGADTPAGMHAFVDRRGGPGDLGTLGGPTSAALAISDTGVIAGSAALPNGDVHAALFSPRLANLGTLGGTTSTAVDVNNPGEAAGSSDTASGARHAFVYRDDVMTDISQSLGAVASAAADINDSGDVVGSFDVPDPSTGGIVSRAFRHALGVSTDLGPGVAVAVNNANQTVVRSGHNSFVFNGVSMAPLGPADSDSFPTPSVNVPTTIANAINDAGQIVGASGLSSGPLRAVLWNPVPASRLTVSPASGFSGQMTTLNAKLVDAVGAPVAGKDVHFVLNDASLGLATTNSNGVASLPASLTGLAAGSYPAAVLAGFAGDAALGPSAGRADLTVITQQVLAPVAAIMTSPAVTTIDDSVDDELDPHVSKNLVTYTDNGPGNTRIRFFDVSTGVRGVVPQTALGQNDMLSDVNDGRITFIRHDGNGATAVLMFEPATGATRVVSAFGTGEFFATAIGGNTVAFVDASIGNAVIGVVDLVTGRREVLDPSPDLQTNPRVSPDGNTIVWAKCHQNWNNCDMFKAQGALGAWIASPVAALSGSNEWHADTDGTWVVYDSNRQSSAGQDIYFQPLAGSIEMRLDIAGTQRNPSISRGVAAFESVDPAGMNSDLFVYVVATNLLYRVTSTPSVNETLSDISVLDNGDIRLVWAANDGLFGRNNIYAATISVPPLAQVGVGLNVSVQPSDLQGRPQPITVTFAQVTRPGVAIATPQSSIPALPSGLLLKGVAYDVQTTAQYVPPVTICFTGTFTAQDSLMHVESGAWRDVTISRTATQICGSVKTLSPFAVATFVDTEPPAVTPPAAITIPATEAGGARSSAWPALATFLAGGTAVDLVDPSPSRLPLQVAGISVDANTLFPIGTTTVAFGFRDAGGNVGTATSTVNVVLGTPKVSVRLLGKGTVSGNRKFLDVELSNTGTGNARGVKLAVILLVPTKGFGIPKLVSPSLSSLPLYLNDLDVGSTTTVRVVFDVPSTVKEVSITEAGTFTNVKGTLRAFLQTQKFVP
jgi:uncharacterized repeat protein (TIGR01451 family)